MSDLGRTLVLTGLALVVVGLACMLGPRLPWLGRLPGDIHVERGDFSFHFPLVTCLVVSAVLSLIASIFLRR
ncbi:MAG: DUF2905 domain-containing protein [Candidatus Binatia bacterium]